MSIVEDVYGRASSLYWLAFLLTARSELSLNVTVEVLESENGFELMFSPRTLPQVRRRVITRALAAIQEEVTAGAEQIELQPSDQIALPFANWSVIPFISQTQFEETVLAIEVFSRCALLLTVFEALHVDDVAELLHVDREMVRYGREAALWELTNRMGSTASAIPLQFERTREPALLR